MAEKSAAAAQTATTRPPVKANKSESISERLERFNDVIARRAYELFERDGQVDGLDVNHWLEAEGELLIPVQTSVEENETGFVVRAEVPGFVASELEVNVEPRRVSLSGKHELNLETKDGDSSRVEESSTEFFRVLDLPSEADATKVSATLKDGVLVVKIPKTETKTTVPVDSQLS